MLKKRLKYVDFNGKEREEDFYFNLTEAELTEMELGTEGGLAEQLEKMVQEDRVSEIIAKFKEIILMSYGEKSADGKRFVKNNEIREAFAQTQAFSDLFMLLGTNAEAGAAFVNGIIPKEVRDRAKKKDIPSTDGK
jgi:hypothetical protein